MQCRQLKLYSHQTKLFINYEQYFKIKSNSALTEKNEQKSNCLEVEITIQNDIN